MLGANTRNVELFGDSVKPTIQIEGVHEGFDVEHVWDVVLQDAFKLFARRRQILIHHYFE